MGWLMLLGQPRRWAKQLIRGALTNHRVNMDCVECKGWTELTFLPGQSDEPLSQIPAVPLDSFSCRDASKDLSMPS